MSPILYGAGLTILALALVASLSAIAATIWPARRKIVSALRGNINSEVETI